MQCNVGKTDRMVRLVAGVAIIAAGFYFQSWWGAIAIIPILTGASRYCPVHQLLGISTDKK